MKKKLLVGALASAMVLSSSVVPVNATTNPSDINNFYSYSITDAKTIQKIVSEYYDNCDYFVGKLDVNNDGVLNVKDSILIQKHCAGSTTISKNYKGKGMDIANSAESYFNARAYDKEFYTFNEYGICLEAGSSTCKLRDMGKNSYIDNVTFTVLSIMGKDYDNSPYKLYKNNKAWSPLAYGTKFGIVNAIKYSDLILDMQNAMSEGYEKVYSTVAEYLVNNWSIVYENGTNTFDINNLRPGDVIIKKDLTFAIVDKDTKGYYEVVNSDDCIIEGEKTEDYYKNLIDEEPLHYGNTISDSSTFAFVCRVK